MPHVARVVIRLRSTFLILTTLVALAAASVLPVAAAAPDGPDCVQVYPWSKLCQGDVGGFIEAAAPEMCVDELAVCVDVDVCSLKECLAPGPCIGGPPCPPRHD